MLECLNRLNKKTLGSPMKKSVNQIVCTSSRAVSFIGSLCKDHFFQSPIRTGLRYTILSDAGLSIRSQGLLKDHDPGEMAGLFSHKWHIVP